MDENEDLESKSIQIATQVIIHAGNARSLVYEAFKEVENENFPACEAKLVQAQEEISSAHNVQTEMIQAEARGEKVQFSLLLTHAQDTLMIAMSELQMARHMVSIVKKLKSNK